MPTAAALTSPPDAAADHLTALAAPTAPLLFHPLSFLDEGDGDVLIGRSDIDSYGVFPADGAALVKELQDGRSPADAAGWYLDRYGESVDMSEFIDTLVELELLRPSSVDDAPSTPTVPQPVRWQRLGRAVFSPVGLVAYLALLAGAVIIMLTDPRLIPAHQNVFFTDYLLLVELTVVVGQAPLILLHEGAHVLAGRRLGLRTRVRLGQRWYFLVFETVMDGLVSVPRRKRYLPILAGVLTDIGVIAALTLIAAATRSPDGEFSLLGGICLALAFTTLPRIAWQFYFFLQTDGYYLISTVLGTVDLHGATRGLLRNQLNRLRGRPELMVPLDTWHPRDRNAARWYAPLMLLGYTLSFAVLAVVVLPLAYSFFSTAAGRVFSGGQGASDAGFWDAAVILTLTIGQLALAVYLGIRRRLESHTAPRHLRQPTRVRHRPSFNIFGNTQTGRHHVRQPDRAPHRFR